MILAELWRKITQYRAFTQQQTCNLYANRSDADTHKKTELLLLHSARPNINKKNIELNIKQVTKILSSCIMTELNLIIKKIYGFLATDKLPFTSSQSLQWDLSYLEVEETEAFQ